MVVVKRSSPGRSDDTFSLPITTIDRQPLLHNGVDRSPASRWTNWTNRAWRKKYYLEKNKLTLHLYETTFQRRFCLLSTLFPLLSNVTPRTLSIFQSSSNRCLPSFIPYFSDSIVSLLSVFSSPRVNLFIQVSSRRYFYVYYQFR